MPELKILENEQITIICYPDSGIIHHVMHKYCHGQVFRDALMAGLEAMKKYKAYKWLSDDRNNPVLHPDDQQWTADVWQKEVLKAGWKVWAIVQPLHSLAKLRMLNLAEVYGTQGLTVQLFDNPDKAMEWIKSVNV